MTNKSALPMNERVNKVSSGWYKLGKFDISKTGTNRWVITTWCNDEVVEVDIAPDLHSAVMMIRWGIYN